MNTAEKNIKRINKNIIILIAILGLLVLQLIAIGLSKAKKIIEISAEVIDKENIVENVEEKINILDDAQGKYIVLPRLANDKAVDIWYVQDKEYTSGEKIYLSQEEVEKNKIKVVVKYLKKDNKYYQVKKVQIGDNQSEVEGYLEKNARVTIEKNDIGEIDSLFKGDIFGVYRIRCVEGNGNEIKSNEEKKITIKEMDGKYNYYFYEVEKKKEYIDKKDDEEIKDALR